MQSRVNSEEEEEEEEQEEEEEEEQEGERQLAASTNPSRVGRGSRGMGTVEGCTDGWMDRRPGQAKCDAMMTSNFIPIGADTPHNSIFVWKSK
jgi:hypothetical protein